MPDKPDPKLIDALITELLEKLPLEDRVNIANLPENQIHILESIMGKYLRHKYKWLSQDELLDDEKEAKAILREVWKRLKETHRMRAVK